MYVLQNGVRVNKNDLQEGYKMTSKSWWYTGGIILLVLIIAALLFYYYKNNKKGSRSSYSRSR